MAETNPNDASNDPSSSSSGSEEDKVIPMVNQGEDQNKNNQSQQQKTPEASTAESETPPNNAIPRDGGSCPSWLIQIMDEVEEAESNHSQGPKIPKVPEKLLKSENKNNECYNPLMVSIGPYHRLDRVEKLKNGESFKNSMTRQFILESGKEEEEFYGVWEVEKVAKQAKEFYDESLIEKIDDDDFTKMMFIDGCFVLQFIHCVTSKYDDLKMSDQEVANVRRDLLLLENQLPYLVLDSLMKLRFKEEERDKMIDEFLQIRKPHESLSKLALLSILFLISFIYFCCCCCLCSWNQTSPPSTPKKKKEATGDKQPAHLLELLYSRFIPVETEESDKSGHRGHYLYYSAKDLKKVGIHFRPSKSNALTNVKFRSSIFTGTLKLPPITIDKSTKSMLLNLVAYESSAVPKKKHWVTSYLCFMDSLINDAEDVKELRSKGIVYNYLGADEEVAKTFNDMTNSLEPETNAYNDVKRKINIQCEDVIKKWVAQWLQNYFSSPWVFIALVAAAFTIFLTAVATYVAVWPIN
ncbi:unnamed protein product [Dovyalis caffra]|uniref:Uncharacterized protein n=1 Tax=Dovyalis caffra TaxID=77055 RepID=A0AAV1RUY4_9ROSI|nr:unnamed protein product [Dovyalis caffra]